MLPSNSWWMRTLSLDGIHLTNAWFLLLFAIVGLLVATEPRAAEGANENPNGAHERLGALEGFVRLTDQRVPQPVLVENSTDPDLCGEAQTLEDMLVSARNRGIRNVIVSLAGVAQHKVPEFVAEPLVLDNRECRFVPHVAVTTIGSTLTMSNSDHLLHNTHLYGDAKGNYALADNAATVVKTVRKEGMIIVRCDVHGWMSAYIRVDSHPFHSVTDEHGHFRIPGIPSGNYTLALWHERLGHQAINIRIEEEATKYIDLNYSLDRKR